MTLPPGRALERLRALKDFPVACRRAVTLTGVAAALAVTLLIGCGTTREYKATEQLVMSAAVDRSIAKIDFRPLSGRKVFLDTSYLNHVKGESFVNAEYVTSALRQQIVAAGCLIQDTNTAADVIIEARIGALGADDHRVTFGIPANTAVASAVSLIPGAPNLPSFPEIALARREAREAAAKVAAFAYDRETRAPLWQSGVGSSLATARDTWVMGVGPFQGGSIREQTKLAGSTIRIGEGNRRGSPVEDFDRPAVDYTAQVRFQQGWPLLYDEGAGPSESEWNELVGDPGMMEAESELADASDDQDTLQR